MIPVEDITWFYVIKEVTALLGCFMAGVLSAAVLLYNFF